MKVIYRAENVIDANLIKGLLEQEGLMAYVNGQFLQGGIGELPASGLISVSVSDSDAEAALKIVEEFEEDMKQESGKGETRWDLSDNLLDWKG